MKKKLSILISLSIMAAVVLFTFTLFSSSEKQLFNANVAALAGDIWALDQGDSYDGPYIVCAETISGLQGEPGLTHKTYCACCCPQLTQETSKLNSHCIP